jgi:hypothetical protein
VRHLRSLRCALMAFVVGVATLVGSPASAAASFVANVEAVTSPAPGQLLVAGWMFDDDAPSTSISYHVYVGGTGPGDPSSWGYDRGLAALRRDDVAAAYPGAGPFHGFHDSWAVPVHGVQPVYIFAINAGGTPGSNALLWSGTVTIANPPPDTTITSRPPATSTNPTATFAFTATEASSFACRWDQGAWTPCTSPATATVAVGSHTFSVVATDTAGAQDPTPASYAFTVAAPPPPPPPPPTPPQVTDPPPPTITLSLRAVRKRSKVRIDIGPDLDPSNYRFLVQRRAGKKWRTVRRTQTLGEREISIIDLPRGTYRVVVPRQHEMTGARAEVRLRR